MNDFQPSRERENCAMPPKRKATGVGRGGKQAKTEPAAAQPSTARQMVDALKKAGDDRKKTAKVDSFCHQLANSGRVSLAFSSKSSRFFFVLIVKVFRNSDVENCIYSPVNSFVVFQADLTH